MEVTYAMAKKFLSKGIRAISLMKNGNCWNPFLKKLSPIRQADLEKKIYVRLLMPFFISIRLDVNGDICPRIFPLIS